MSEEQRLYGTPGADRMHFEPETVYEEIDSDFDEERGQGHSAIIEEWSVHDPKYHLPAAHVVLEWMDEWVADNGEIGEDYALNSAFDEEVIASTRALLDLIASKVTYRQADKHLRDMTVTWDVDGEPLLDGEPIYRKAPGPLGKSGVRGG